MIDISNAIELTLGRVLPLRGTEILTLEDALGRVLSEDITARKDMPGFDNSALDGYAYNSAAVDKILKIKEPTIFAGDKNFYEISELEAQKIMTGAPMPAGADGIVRLEDVEPKNGELQLPQDIKIGDGFRKKGEEVRAGEILLHASEVLTPAKIMLLAAQGIYEISVFTLPKIALFSTGDELKEPWQSADEREIYNANSSGIRALLRKAGFASEYLGIIRDEKSAVVEALRSACEKFDVVISSGGASAGEADFMQKALEDLGFARVFDHINVKPGRPTKCYEKDGKFVFAMAGNPLAAFIQTRVLFLPILRKISGEGGECLNPEPILAEAKSLIKSRPSRIDITLGIYKDGGFTPVQTQSGMIKPLSLCTHYFVSSASGETAEKGEIIKIYEI